MNAELLTPAQKAAKTRRANALMAKNRRRTAQDEQETIRAGMFDILRSADATAAEKLRAAEILQNYVNLPR